MALFLSFSGCSQKVKKEVVIPKLPTFDIPKQKIEVYNKGDLVCTKKEDYKKLVLYIRKLKKTIEICNELHIKLNKGDLK